MTVRGRRRRRRRSRRSSSADFFGYTEPTLRGPVVVAVFAEILAIVTFAMLASSARRDLA